MDGWCVTWPLFHHNVECIICVEAIEYSHLNERTMRHYKYAADFRSGSDIDENVITVLNVVSKDAILER